MSDLSFTWKGISSNAYGLQVTKLPPITGWQVRDVAWPVPARDGALHVRDGALEEAQWQVVFYLPYEQGVTAEDIKVIKTWLLGDGWFTASNQPGYKFYASIIDPNTYEDWVAGFTDKVATVYFQVSPYSYRTDSPIDIEITNTSGIITNSGLAVCKPEWTIYGSGNIVLTVGSQICELEDIDGHITIDVSLPLCHKDGVPCYKKLTGEFPILVPGANAYAIAADGTFTKLVYTPNWRDR